jgi:monofunctional glycosyltransferase
MAAMESKQAAALGRALEASSTDMGLVKSIGSEAPTLPRELLPFPPPAARRRLTLWDIAKGALVWIAAVQLCYLVATSLLISIYRHVDPPVTVLMAYRKWFFNWNLEAPRPVPLKKVPRYIRSMLVAVEDGKFYQHHGLDFEAFQRAREINKRVGKPLYGGSTLTMQVARTLFLVPEKSYIRKYLEVLTALELEALLPKDRILELYFGYAEWGKGLFGMESAARKWYGRGISALTRDEATRLIALLSSPIKYGPDTLRKNGILKERYRYLTARFVPSAPEAEAAPQAEAPPPSGESAAATDQKAPAADQLPPEAGGSAPSAEQPPPSVEPGEETDAGLEPESGSSAGDLRSE